MKDCTCKGWEENAPKLSCILSMAQLRNGSGYKGKFFEYCPWCGKKGEATNEINANFATDLLMKDPETGEELRPTSAVDDNGDGGYSLIVSNADGSRRWKHTIKTEEI